jgi:hypothetical protein
VWNIIDGLVDWQICLVVLYLESDAVVIFSEAKLRNNFLTFEDPPDGGQA